MTDEEVQKFANDDQDEDEAPPRAFTSDEERERAASAGASVEGNLPLPRKRGRPRKVSAIATLITEECDALKAAGMLVENVATFAGPVRIFSNAGPLDQLLGRIDEQLAQLARVGGTPTTAELDGLIGSLLLLRVARRDPQGFAEAARA